MRGTEVVFTTSRRPGRCSMLSLPRANATSIRRTATETGRASRCWAIWASRRTSRSRRGSRPCPTRHGHEPDILKHSVRTSLERLRTGSVAILYLAYRDSGTPLEDTLRAVDELHREGVFREFGLSNFSAADVQTVRSTCSANRWVLPTRYQGLYNAVSRRAGDELLPDLAEIGMRFHACNPLARGAFAPGFESRQAEPGSLWDPDLPQGQLYRSLYL